MSKNEMRKTEAFKAMLVNKLQCTWIHTWSLWWKLRVRPVIILDQTGGMLSEDSSVRPKKTLENKTFEVTALKTFNSYICRYKNYRPFFRCSSYVGRIGGHQTISVGNEDQSIVCKRGNIIHEIAHALGFFHEHSRPDRDNYVDVLWDNVVSGECSLMTTFVGGNKKIIEFDFQLEKENKCQDLSQKRIFRILQSYTPLFDCSPSWAQTVYIFIYFLFHFYYHLIYFRRRLSKINLAKSNFKTSNSLNAVCYIAYFVILFTIGSLNKVHFLFSSSDFESVFA